MAIIRCTHGVCLDRSVHACSSLYHTIMVHDHEIAITDLERRQAQHNPNVQTSPEYFSMDAAESEPNMNVPFPPKASQDKFDEPLHFAVERVAPATSTIFRTRDTRDLSKPKTERRNSDVHPAKNVHVGCHCWVLMIFLCRAPLLKILEECRESIHQLTVRQVKSISSYCRPPMRVSRRTSNS